MFQTNQGPSFPAHQFLFSGTSAPLAYNDPQIPCGATYPCYEWFDAENVGGSAGKTTGCIAAAGRTSLGIDPSSSESYEASPFGFPNGYPCYDHLALSDVLDNAGVSWKYYARSASSLWTAPTAINGVCKTEEAAAEPAPAPIG